MALLSCKLDDLLRFKALDDVEAAFAAPAVLNGELSEGRRLLLAPEGDINWSPGIVVSGEAGIFGELLAFLLLIDCIEGEEGD